MDNQALVPDLPLLDAEALEPVESLAVQIAEDEDKELAALTASKGWQRLVDDMKADIERFKTGGFIKNIESLSLEEVGKLFVIHQTVASELQKYLDKVEHAAQAVADNERRKLKK